MTCVFCSDHICCRVTEKWLWKEAGVQGQPLGKGGPGHKLLIKAFTHVHRSGRVSLPTVSVVAAVFFQAPEIPDCPRPVLLEWGRIAGSWLRKEEGKGWGGRAGALGAVGRMG